jgi:hypothetical protein
MDVCSGPEAKEIFDSKTEQVRNSPGFVSFSIEMENADIALQTAELLNQLVSPMIESVPQIAPFIQMGLKYEIRAYQNKLTFEIYGEAMIAELFVNSFNQFQTEYINNMNVSGEGTLHLFTNAGITDIYSNEVNPWTLLEKALNFKANFSTKAYNLRGAVDAVCGVLEDQCNIGGGIQSNKFKAAIMVTRVASVLRSFDLDFKFDPSNILELIILQLEKSHVAEEGYSNLKFEEFKKKIREDQTTTGETVSALRNHFESIIYQAQMYKDMIPPEFIDIIKAINLEKFEFQIGLNTEKCRLFYKITLNLPGMNTLRETILN